MKIYWITSIRKDNKLTDLKSVSLPPEPKIRIIEGEAVPTERKPDESIGNAKAAKPLDATIESPQPFDEILKELGVKR